MEDGTQRVWYQQPTGMAPLPRRVLHVAVFLVKHCAAHWLTVLTYMLAGSLRLVLLNLEKLRAHRRCSLPWTLLTSLRKIRAANGAQVLFFTYLLTERQVSSTYTAQRKSVDR